jgi:NAD(P)-dependent dehydrogenase (short-subunit alcohol dehydrogenase family)
MTSSILKPNILEGRAAFVTGGATGICFEIAKAFL